MQYILKNPSTVRSSVLRCGRLLSLLVLALCLVSCGTNSDNARPESGPDRSDNAALDDSEAQLADRVSDDAASGDGHGDRASEQAATVYEPADSATDDAATVYEAASPAEYSGDVYEEAGQASSSGTALGREKSESMSANSQWYGAVQDDSLRASGDHLSESGQDRADSGSVDSSSDAEGLFADEPQTAPEQLSRPAPDRLRDNRFAHYGYRDFIATDIDHRSTFALDVDTASYTVTRRWIAEGVLPPPSAVRVEELINAFDYDYDVPSSGLEISIDGGPSPFDADNFLVRVGVAAEKVDDDDRPPVALTFVVDTSGSMEQDNRLGLVRDSLHVLVEQLNTDDTLAIVEYSERSGVLLAPTPIRAREEIRYAIDSLRPGGSTNLEAGLREGYELAEQAYRRDGINRVVIASDGVANAGITDPDVLARSLADYRDRGIHLVTVGYGMGNFNDVMMEQLANNADGFYAYVDTLAEAERLFSSELTSTLLTAAVDAKIQVEFNQDVVEAYRLIGFENRGVHDRDFRNDRVDAGELGAGHQVTAMYELRLRPGVTIEDRARIAQVFLRWQNPNTGAIIEIDDFINLRDVEPRFASADLDLQLATVVAALGEVLRDNPHGDNVNLAQVTAEARRLSHKIGRDDVYDLVEMLQRASSLRR